MAGLFLLTRLLDLPAKPPSGFLAQVGRPEGWPFFAWFLAPLGLGLMSASCEILTHWFLRRGPDQAPRPALAKQARRADLLAYLAIPLWSLCLLLQHRLDWALLSGLILVAALAWQAFVCGRLLWRASSLQEPAQDKFLAWGSALLAIALFAALSLWTIQAVSTAGDETRYLIDTDRLLHSAGLSSSPTLEARPRQEFYWGRWSRFLGEPLREASIFSGLLAPGVGLAGRAGALWILSLAGALCLSVFFLCGRSLGYEQRPVLVATWALGACAPYLQLTQHIYPGILGTLGVTLGLWLLCQQSGRFYLRLAGLGLTAGLMTMTKFRLIFPAMGLVLAGGGAWLSQRGWGRLARYLGWLLLLAGALVVLLLALEATLWPRLDLWRKLAVFSWNMYPDWGRIAASLPAMFLDQEFGLFFYAPWLALGLVGVWSFGKRHPAALIPSLLVAAFTLAPLILYRWQQWDGGYTPPARFVAPLLPILALWALPILSRPASRLVTSALSFLLAASGLLSLILAAIPRWRYHRGLGINNLLQQTSGWLDLEMGRFFPSFISYRAPDMATSFYWLAALALLGLIWWRACKRGDGHGKTLTKGAFFAGLAGLAALLIVLAVLGRTLPTGSLEAESLTRKGGLLWGSYYTQPKLFLMRKGDSLSGRINWGKDSKELAIRAYHVEVDKKPGATHAAPLLLVKVGEAPPVELRIGGSKLGPYIVKLDLSPGRKDLSLTCLAQQGRDQVALDRIAVR